MTKKEIEELYYYKEGELHNKNYRCGRALKDAKVGAVNKYGYKIVFINRKSYYVHRLVWILHYGTIDKSLQIDHINRDKLDNRIENLRLVTSSENNFNRRKWAKDLNYDN